MIQAQELMIGNKVTCINENAAISYATILSIDGFNRKINVNECKLKFDLDNGEVRPVPLTPELLKKCGFVEHKPHSYLDATYYYKYINEKTKIFFDANLSDTMVGDSYYERECGNNYCDANEKPSVNHCQYLHQLQNIFYVLTGEQLKVQL